MQEDEHEQELCRKALHWIGLSYKEIDSRAMCEAISIQDDVDAVDKELLVDPDWVSRNCSSLIRLAGQDSDYPHFQLAHFTVKEYLRSIKPQSRRSSFRFSEDEAMQQLLRTSLRFLTFPIFDRKPTIASSEIQRMAQRNENHPFYPVAAGYIFCSGGYYWDDDFRDELSLLLQDEAMMGYATKLFSPEKTAIFLSWILQAMWYWPRVTRYEKNFSRIIGLLVAPEFSTLHVAAMLALPSICTHLIESEKVDLNIYCCLGTPLHALLAGVSFLFPGSFEYDKEIHYRWHHSSSKPAVYDQARQCVEIFVKHCADTSPQWNGINVFQMAIESSIRAEYQELWIEPLINPSTVVNDSCIESFKAGLDAGFTNRSMLDVIFTVGSNLEVPSGWARLASLVQTSRMLERDCERGDNPHDAQARLSDEDFNDGIQISLERRLTDTFGALIQDSRFRPDLFIWRENSKSVPILHFAIQYGNIRSVELLLEAGCDPGFVDESDGWTTLHECALCDTEDAEIATLLLKSGVTDSVTDKLGETCWHIAAENGNIPVLKVLIDLGSDTQQSLATISRAGRTPLASAIHNGEVESALLLLHHCNAELGAFQSDESLLDKAVAIGSDDLFPRLHEKLKLADAKESLQGSEPLENINLDCSPKLVEYLLTCWAVDSNSRSRALQKYLLDANTDGFDHPDQYPPRADMDHIIRRLLPPIGVADDDGTSPQHFWSIFCEKVVPHLTRVCNHEKHRCRMGLISMIFEILIDSGVLEPHDQNAGLPSYRLLFQALVDRGDRLNCSWVASVVQKVIEASSQPVDLLNEPVAHELLSQALRQSNVDLVCQLLDYGLDVHAAHGRLSTVEQSCYTSDLSMFHSIIEHSDKTLINRAGSHGKTLLHWAVSGTTPGYLNKIQELLKLGAKIDAKVDDPNTDTALTLASRSDRQDIVALLVSEGADPLHRGHDGWSILHAAALTGDLQYIQYLRLPDVPDSFWRGTCEYPLLSCDKRPHMTQNTAAIHLAAAKGRSNFLRFMSQHDVAFDVNAVTGYPTMTPLHLASLFGNLDVVELLVSAKANINARAAHGRLAIDFAALGGHLAVVKTLLKCGSETPSNDSSASIALLMSKERECTEDLGDSQAMARFRFEKSIIHGHLDHCKELVARGQSINAQLLTHSYTPLVRAVVQGQTSIVDWLVSMGVEVTNPVIRTLHPSLRCIASLTTHHIPSARTVAAVLDLALKQNVSWFQSILGPLHVAILDSKVEALDVILKHVRENDHAYRYEPRGPED
jgi:ankyrin repeat protein